MKTKATIHSVQEFQIRGPWVTKSKASLDVLAALSHEQTSQLFAYDEDELSAVDEDIRGLRVYRVSNLQTGAIGGNEWHRIKKELVFVTRGSIQWSLRDQNGETKECILTPNNCSLLIPPYILHTYEVLEDDSEIIVITNTLYNVDNSKTFDTYPIDTFPTN